MDAEMHDQNYTQVWDLTISCVGSIWFLDVSVYKVNEGWFFVCLFICFLFLFFWVKNPKGP